MKKRNKLFDEVYKWMPLEARVRETRIIDLLNAIDDADNDTLYKCYAEALDAFRRRLCDLWQMEYEDAWWAGEDIAGEVLCIGDYYIKEEDVILLVLHEVSFDDFMPWYMQWIDTGTRNISLGAWLKGEREAVGNKSKENNGAE